MAYQTGTLTGSYTHFDGTPHEGVVEIRPDNIRGNTIRDAAGNKVLSGPFTGKSAIALVAGEFSVDLPASNDSTLDPAGTTYTVYVRLTASGAGQKAVKGVFITAGQTVDMADLVSVSPADASYQERVNEATTSATNAAGSATAAAGSATAAASSATAAAGSATTAQAAATTATGAAANLSTASTTTQGIVELATNTETTTGTDTVRAVTPAGVAAVAATKQALQQVANAVTVDGAAVVSKHNQIDATGAARTITLPTGQAEGTVLSVEKVDASTNAVTITGNMRGVGAQSIALASQYEVRTFLADSAGSWHPLADHRTKTSLDASYANLPSPLKYGGKGDGTTDDTAAIQALLNSGAAGVTLLGKTWAVSSALVLPIAAPKVYGGGATIKATASMAAVIDTPTGLTSASTVIRGGVFDLTLDCNGLAISGIQLRTYLDFKMERLRVLTATGDAIVLGVTGAPFPGPGAAGVFLTDVDVDSQAAVTAGTKGIRVFGTDNKLERVTSVGCDIAFSVESGGNKFVACHGFGHFGKKPTTIFKDSSLGNEYIGCHADSAVSYGWDLSGFNTRIIGGEVFANTDTADNTLIGVNIRSGSGFHDIDKVYFHGNDSSHRVAQDIAGAAGDLANCNIGSFTYGNTVTQYLAADQYTGGTTLAASATQHIRAAVGQQRRIQWETGASPRWRLVAESTAESGSNAGSDLVLVALDDTGTFLREEFRWSRKFGTVTPGAALAQLSVSALGKTSAYTITANDVLIFASNGAAITLPAASSGLGNGTLKTVKNTGILDVVVTSAGGSIENGAQVTIPPGDSFDFASDGTNWWVI